MSSASARGPIGHAAWAAPFLSSAHHVIGASVVAPVTLRELAAFAGREPATLLDVDTLMDYGPAGGSADLRKAIATDLEGLPPDSIAVTSGAGDALAAVAGLMCRPGTHVVVQTPVHGSVRAAIDRGGCAVTVLDVPLDTTAVIDQLRPSTTAVFLTSPHNPTGQVLGQADLTALAEALDALGALLVVDEVFHGVPLGMSMSPPPVAAIARNGVSIGGLSKVYGLPGLRIGWLAGPLLLVDDVTSAQRSTTQCLPRTSEALAMLALGCRRALLARARSLVYDAFIELTSICDRHDGIRLALPDGGISAFPEIDVPDVDRWCARVAEDRGLLLAPGGACFGLPGRVRINLALAPRVRSEAFPLLAHALADALKLSRNA